MIDTHAHIYDVKFNEDRNEAIQRAKDNGITKILMPNWCTLSWSSCQVNK